MCHAPTLGIAVVFDGPDAHGQNKLADGTGGRTEARHTELKVAWKQVLREAGGTIPDRNVERVMSTTHIPVPQGDQRRIDLVVPGLNVARGLPLFCDVTVVSPITRRGLARSGTSNRGGSLLDTAERINNTHHLPRSGKQRPGIVVLSRGRGLRQMGESMHSPGAGAR